MSSNLPQLRYQGVSKIVLTKWKVSKGFAINQIPFVIFTYRECSLDGSPQGPDQKYKINQSGIIVKQLYKKINDIIDLEDVLFTYEHCSHPTLMKDLCAVCGVNINNFDSVEQRKISENTSVSMVHSIPELRVSKKVAEDLGRADENRLLKSRKLVLLVDLDQTIVHSTNQDIPVEIPDIFHYQLYGQNSPWYHTKFRPFMTEFLEEVSKYYELHICTFGARRYAHQIAHLIDPKCKYFPKDRILSRDEFFDPRSKTGNMKSLFPCGDSMVCIIDDRVDVWNYLPNVVHVKPYLCFKTDDINAPEKLNIGYNNSSVVNKECNNEEKKDTVTECDKNDKCEKTVESETNTQSESSADEGNDKKVETLSEKTDKENNITKETNNETVEDSQNNYKNHKQTKFVSKDYESLLEDKDDYLLYLKDILIKIHKEYYGEYDRKLRYWCEGEEILIPDLKKIIPHVRKLILHGVNIVFSGVIATNMPVKFNRFYRLAESLGAIVTNDIIVNGSPKTTHLVASKWGTIKVNKCLKYNHIKMVTPDWLIICAERWEKVDEDLFLLTKDTVYNINDKDDSKKIFIPYEQSYHRIKRQIQAETPSTSSAIDPDAEEDDSKTMLDLSPLSSFSLNDLSDMGKEVDDACSDGDYHFKDSSDDESSDGEEKEFNQPKDKKRYFDEEEDGMNYANEGEYPQGWQKLSLGTKRGLKRTKNEFDDDEDMSNNETDSNDETNLSSSSDAESIGSVDEEMVAALEKEFFKST